RRPVGHQELAGRVERALDAVLVISHVGEEAAHPNLQFIRTMHLGCRCLPSQRHNPQARTDSSDQGTRSLCTLRRQQQRIFVLSNIDYAFRACNFPSDAPTDFDACARNHSTICATVFSRSAGISLSTSWNWPVSMCSVLSEEPMRSNTTRACVASATRSASPTMSRSG